MAAEPDYMLYRWRTETILAATRRHECVLITSQTCCSGLRPSDSQAPGVRCTSKLLPASISAMTIVPSRLSDIILAGTMFLALNARGNSPAIMMSPARIAIRILEPTSTLDSGTSTSVVAPFSRQSIVPESLLIETTVASKKFSNPAS